MVVDQMLIPNLNVLNILSRLFRLKYLIELFNKYQECLIKILLKYSLSGVLLSQSINQDSNSQKMSKVEREQKENSLISHKVIRVIAILDSHLAILM